MTIWDNYNLVSDLDYLKKEVINEVIVLINDEIKALKIG